MQEQSQPPCPIAQPSSSTYIPLVCPVSVLGQEPVSTDQIFSWKSDPPVRATTPEGKNLQVVTSLTRPSRVRCRDGRGREERRETFILMAWQQVVRPLLC